MSALLLLIALVSTQTVELDARFLEGRKQFVAGDYAKARQIWLPLARAGDPQAQFSLAFLHDRGLGVAANAMQAVYWYERAAWQGLAVAQFNLGNAYRSGRGVATDNDQATRWWRLAAEQGLTEAVFNLAQHQLRGFATAQMPGETVLLLRRAAAAGHQGAVQMLADEAFTDVRGALIALRDGHIELTLDQSVDFDGNTPAAGGASEFGRQLEIAAGLLATEMPNPPEADELEALGDIYAQLAAMSYEQAPSMRTDVKRGFLISAEAPGAPRQKSRSDSIEGALATFDRWSEAWVAQDVSAYLAQYSDRFVPADGRTLSQWRSLRARRLTKPAFVNIEIVGFEASVTAPGEVAFEFTQIYRSDTFEEESQKRLVMERQQDQWLIVSESNVQSRK